MLSSHRFFPSLIAHRGASAYAPENTLSAFKKAADLNCKWVEFDVMVSPADPEHIPFIFHDKYVNRTTNGTGNVEDFTYSELRKLDAGAWFSPDYQGEHIPTLQEVVDFLIANNMSANVEIKPLPDEEERTVIEALRVIVESFPQPNPSILFSSFSVSALHYLRQYAPDAYLGLLLKDWNPCWENTCADLRCISVNADEKIVTEADVKKIKRLNLGLFCYTVDDPKRANELYSWGVDAVFSNAPNVIGVKSSL